MPPDQPSLRQQSTGPLAPPEEVVTLTVDADGTPRAIGDLTESLPPKSAGLLRAVAYTRADADVLGAAAERVELLERYADVVREGAARLRPMLNNALGLQQTVTLDQVFEAFEHLAKMRPEDLHAPEYDLDDELDSGQSRGVTSGRTWAIESVRWAASGPQRPRRVRGPAARPPRA